MSLRPVADIDQKEINLNQVAEQAQRSLRIAQNAITSIIANTIIGI